MLKELNTTLTIENKPQAESMMTLLSTLDQNGKKAMLDFFQGAKFMQNLMIATAGTGSLERSSA